MDILSSKIATLGRRLPPEFFTLNAEKLAPQLLGKVLVRVWENHCLGGMICETEAYTEDDPASHTFRGMNARNRSMFATPGTMYVYQSYGIHWCLNIKSGVEGRGEGVLIRALQPLYGQETMRKMRHLPQAKPEHELCNGPGKLTQALAIDKRFDGLSINKENIFLFEPSDKVLEQSALTRGPRIGISEGLDLMWRFALKKHPCLSKPFPAVRG